MRGSTCSTQAARRIRAHPVGTVRIAALAAIAMAILPAVIARFRILYPDIKIIVESLGQRAIEERVFLGQADFGVGVDMQGREGIRSTPLARAEYVCILPANHPLAARERLEIADLAGEEFVGPMHEADALWTGIDTALETSGITVSRRLETQHSQILYAFVEAGLGVTIAEPFSAPRFHRLGVAVRPISPPVYLDFALLEPDIGPTPEIVALAERRCGARDRGVPRACEAGGRVAIALPGGLRMYGHGVASGRP